MQGMNEAADDRLMAEPPPESICVQSIDFNIWPSQDALSLEYSEQV